MGTTKTLYIYGMSGHGHVVADIAVACGYKIAGWIDDDPSKNVYNWNDFQQTHTQCSIALGIGNNVLRAQITKRITDAGYILPTLIHPSSIVSPSSIIAEGTVIMPLCVINAHTTIGKGVIINSGAVIEHDCTLTDYVHISPNVSLAGGITIGNFTHVGIGSSIIQNITIGDNTIIGAGSVVITNLPSNCTAIGVPSKITRS